MNQLTKYVTNDPLKVAEHFARSGYFKDASDISKAFVKIAAGREMGIPDIAAMNGIHIVQGKLEISARLMSSLVKSSGKYNYRVTEQSNEICTIVFFEGKEKIGSASFTIEEAKQAGLANKENWRNYASDMLFARAMSRGVRRHCPDALNGIVAYVDGEIPQPKGEAEEVVDADVKEVEPPAESSPPPTEDKSERPRTTEYALALVSHAKTLGLDMGVVADVVRDCNYNSTTLDYPGLCLVCEKLAIDVPAEVLS